MRGQIEMLSKLRLAALAVLLSLAAGGPAFAQEATGMPADALATQSLRAHWHVFIAYAIVIVLVFGYVVWMARKLSALEARLAE